MSQVFAATSTTIGPYHYSVTPLDAVAGRDAFLRYAAIMGAMATAAAAVEGDENAKGTAVGVAYLKNFSSADMKYFCDLFSPLTSVKGLDYKGAPQLNDVFSTHFVKRYADLMKWISFCFEVNEFQRFFAEMKEEKGA